MVPATLNFTSWVGDTVRMRVSLTTKDPENPEGPEIPLVITGCTAEAQCRTAKKSPDVLAQFRARVLDGAAGLVELYIPASVANALQEGKFPWDMQLTWPVLEGDEEGDVGTYLAGTWTLTQDVTKAVITP